MASSTLHHPPGAGLVAPIGVAPTALAMDIVQRHLSKPWKQFTNFRFQRNSSIFAFVADTADTADTTLQQQHLRRIIRHDCYMIDLMIIDGLFVWYDCSFS